MADVVRKIRKVQTSKVADFDDQLWPINCAIVILAGFVVGIVIATSDFTTDRIIYNGWARLISVAAMMGLLFWGVVLLQGKMVRRLQLCILISLLAHLWMAVYLHQQYLELMALKEVEAARQGDQPPQPIAPEYDVRQIEQPQQRQSFEKPIETPAPMPTEPEAIRRAADGPQVPTSIDQPEEPEVPQRQQPDPAVTRRAELSAPRRADAAAGANISRQEWKHRPRPNQPIPEQIVTPQAGRAAAVPNVNIAPHRQRDTQVRIDQRQTFEDFSSTRAEPPEVRIGRRANRPRPIPDAPTTPRPSRQAHRPAEIPRTEAAAPQPARVAQQPQPRRLSPPQRSVARRQADDPAMVRPNREPAPVPAVPQAAALAAAPSRRTQRPPQRTETPRPTTLSRQTARFELPSGSAPSPAAAGTTSAAVGPPATASTEPALPAIRPSRISTSRAADLLAQAPQDQPDGRALPAVTSAAQLPSALAARRAAASQQVPAGTDAAPARPSSLARASQGASLPSNVLPSRSPPAATPAATGGTPASRLNLAASAAVRRRAASPAPGSGRTAAGIADLAIGSDRIVSQSGQPRSTGSGQPSVTANAAVPRIARAEGPAPPSTASGVAQATPAATGSAASSARGPSTPSPNIRGSAARRGGSVSPQTPQTAVGSGPAGSSGTAGAVGIATANRVARQESIEVAISGSGTPRPGRSTGGATAPSVTAVALEAAPGGASSGTASQAPPLQAQLSGPRRHVSGLPGGIESQPAAGALDSLVDEAAPLASGVARRGTPSGRRPEGMDLSAAESGTLKRDPAGANLPTPAVAMATPAQSGAGGVTIARGGLPSSLAIGPSTTVRRAAADVPVAQATAAPGSSQSSQGSALVVAMAGRARAGSQGVPAPISGVAGPVVNRSSTESAISAGGSAQTRPEVETVAGGPSDGPAQPAPGTTAAAVARGSGRLAADQPAAVPAASAAPGVGAVAAMSASRATRHDLVPVDTGAVAGEVPRPGARRTVGQADAAVELTQAGPSTPTADSAEAPIRLELAGIERQMAGLPGELIDAIAIETAADPGPASATPATAAGRRRLPQGEDQESLSLAAEIGRGPLRNTDIPGLPRGVAEVTEQDPVASAAASERGNVVDLAEGIDAGEPSRREGGLPVQIAAVAGPGGLGYDLSPEVGLPSRLARPESEIIHTVSRRFVIKRSGGELAIDGRIRRQPTDSFRQRGVGRRAHVAQAWGGSEGTEKAVEMGLDYFARHQFPDGHWSLHELPPGLRYDDPALGEMRADAAATGLALLTYLGAGYTHLDDKHRAVVNRGIDWLVRNQKQDGDLFTGGTKYAWFYSHGIATIALCESYGMTRDPELREPARKAVQFICKTQHPTRGGWRYFVDARGVSTETDTSVSGWMLMALKSAQMAELEVPEETLAKIDDWLQTAAAPRAEGQYAYNPFAKNTDRQRHGREPSLAMTAEAMLMRIYLGRGREDPGLIAGADHLQRNLPAVGTRAQRLRDCYYWYYATQVMFQMQDDYWTAWNDRLRSLLAGSQIQAGEPAGSWHPQKPVPDKWGNAGGRHYVTALHLLMMEVYYRYPHLPLFQELSK